jgi:DNA-binding response OmpR family regulator
MQARRRGHRMPIIMLSGAASETDIVSGLEAGANDYIIKPFRANELLARIETQLRLHKLSDHAAFAIGPYMFQPSKKLLVGPNKKQIRLTSKEVDILKFLYRNANREVSRHVLLVEVWGLNGAVTHTLDTHIYRLRQKIEPDPSTCTILVTAPGGYKLDTGEFLPV